MSRPSPLPKGTSRKGNPLLLCYCHHLPTTDVKVDWLHASPILADDLWGVLQLHLVKVGAMLLSPGRFMGDPFKLGGPGAEPLLSRVRGQASPSFSLPEGSSEVQGLLSASPAPEPACAQVLAAGLLPLPGPPGWQVALEGGN